MYLRTRWIQPLRFAVETHCEMKQYATRQGGAQDIQGWTPCSDRAGYQLSVEREYSTAQQYTVSESHNCASVHKTSRKLSHVAVSRTHFSNTPPHLTRPTSPSSSGRVGGNSENQVSDPNYTFGRVVCELYIYMDIRVTVLAHLPDRTGRQTDRQLN